jgi:hypothetical protein
MLQQMVLCVFKRPSMDLVCSKEPVATSLQADASSGMEIVSSEDESQAATPPRVRSGCKAALSPAMQACLQSQQQLPLCQAKPSQDALRANSIQGGVEFEQQHKRCDSSNTVRLNRMVRLVEQQAAFLADVRSGRVAPMSEGALQGMLGCIAFHGQQDIEWVSGPYI